MLIAQQLCSVIFTAYIGDVLGILADSQTAMLKYNERMIVTSPAMLQQGH